MGKRVMVVDDMLFMRSSLKKIIEDGGYEIVCEAVDGNDAVNKFKQYLPDLVTLDLSMPRKNGIEVLEEIKAIKKEVKVIVISAMGQQKNVLKAIKLGADNFIVKPFNPAKVLGIIKGVMR